MTKVDFVTANYESSATREIQGNRGKIQRYLQQGYYIKEERNGYWVLVKPARLVVTVKNGDSMEKHDMKDDVVRHYSRKRISETLFYRFFSDAEAGKIKFYFDNQGYLCMR